MCGRRSGGGLCYIPLGSVAAQRSGEMWEYGFSDDRLLYSRTIDAASGVEKR